MITNRDDLVNGMGNSTAPVLQAIKNSIGNQGAGGYTSTWKATGVPFTGSNPVAVSGTNYVCDRSTVGCFQNWSDPVAPARTYIAWWSFNYQNAGGEIQLHDRIAAMGGLSGTVTTAQTVALDVSTVLASSNIAARIGRSDYSELQWWLEMYTDTGATPQAGTVSVVYDDGSTDVIAISMIATQRASRLFPLRPNAAGRFIRSITSCTLAGSTGTVGNFGFTVTKPIAVLALTIGNTPSKQSWAEMGLPRVHDNSCLFYVMLPSAVGTINYWSFLRLIQQ